MKKTSLLFFGILNIYLQLIHLQKTEALEESSKYVQSTYLATGIPFTREAALNAFTPKLQKDADLLCVDKNNFAELSNIDLIGFYVYNDAVIGRVSAIYKCINQPLSDLVQSEVKIRDKEVKWLSGFFDINNQNYLFAITHNAGCNNAELLTYEEVSCDPTKLEKLKLDSKEKLACIQLRYLSNGRCEATTSSTFSISRSSIKLWKKFRDAKTFVFVNKDNAPIAVEDFNSILMVH